MSAVRISAASTAFLIALAAADAGAQQITIGASPLRSDLEATAGSETTQPIRISNGGDDRVQMRASIADWTLTPAGDSVYLKPGGTTWGCGPWLTLSPREFELAPRSFQLVRYSMKVPPETKEGGYHCVVLLETLPPPKEKLQNVASVVNLIRVASTIYVTVGKPSIVAKIESLKLAPGVRDGKTVWEIATRFLNEGTTQYRVNGTAEISRLGEGSEAAAVRKLEFPGGPVLPGVPRTYLLAVEDALPPGRYLVRAEVDVGLKEKLVAETRVTIEGGGARE